MRPGWQVDRCSIGVQAARWGEASSMMGRQDGGEAAMQTREARREKQVGQPRQCSSKQQDGEKQVGQDGGGTSSNTDRRCKQQDGEAWQARQDKEQAASKMGKTQASSKQGKMGEAVSSNAW